MKRKHSTETATSRRIGRELIDLSEVRAAGGDLRLNVVAPPGVASDPASR